MTLPLRVAMHPSVAGLSEVARECYIELWDELGPADRGAFRWYTEGRPCNPLIVELVDAGLLAPTDDDEHYPTGLRLYDVLDPSVE